MDVEITPLPALRVGVVRGDMAHMQQSWERLMAIAGPAGLMGKPGVAIAAIVPVEVITEPASTPPERRRYDAAIVVPEDALLPAGLIEDRVPAGRYARAVYIGPYEGLARPGGASPPSGCQPAASAWATASATRSTATTRRRCPRPSSAPTCTSRWRSRYG